MRNEKRKLRRCEVCDYLLADDPEYKHSAQRYEVLWKLLKHCRSDSVVESHNRFDSIVGSHLANLFPERADDCLDRLLKLADDPNWPDHGAAIIDICRFFPKASARARDRVLDKLEVFIKDAALDEDAVFALGFIAEADAHDSGKVHPRVQRYIDSADKLPQESRWLLISERTRIPEILKERATQDTKSK
jgi:hypothetical protein